MSKPPCTAPAKYGPCRAFALPGLETCRVHSPQHAALVAADRVRGGRSASRLRALKGRRPKLDTPRALVKFVADLAQDTLSGAVEPDVSRAVAYCVSLQMRLLEASDLERRVAELEARYGASGRVAR